MTDDGWSVAGTSARLRHVWDAGGTAFGGWCSIGSAYVAELTGRSGADWVGIDTQHGQIADVELPGMLQALAVTRTPAVVRVPWNSPDAIMRVLDAGANGVIVPMIDSRQDAEAAVAACRYPPAGLRSWGGTRASVGVPGHTAQVANDSVLCVPMIETVGACEDLDGILAVPGVDAVFVGPNDLALAHGFEPSVEARDPRHERKILEIRDACRAAGVVAGIFAGTAETGARWAREGFQLVSLVSDVTLIAGGTREMLERAR